MEKISFAKLIGGRNKGRFAVLLKHMARSIGISPEELCGRFLPYSKDDWSPEDNLLNAIHNIKLLNHCYADIDMYGYPFYFDILRMSYSNCLFLINRIHEQDCYRLKDLVAEDPIIMDVGAHIGIFTRYVLNKKAKSTVYAFEPDRESFRLLEMNFRDFHNVFCFQKACSNQKDYLELFTSKKIDWRSSLMIKKHFKGKPEFDSDEYSTSYRVEVTDIDSFVAEAGIKRLDLLKITVPGEIEHLVLSGATQTINEFRPQVSFYIYHCNLQEIEAFFQKIGGYDKPRPYIPPGGQKRIEIVVFQPS